MLAVSLGRLFILYRYDRFVLQDRYNVTKESVTIKVEFKDVNYAMEDVDAASKIVRRRGRGRDTGFV